MKANNVVVLVLIMVLAGGAIGMYLNRQGGEVEAARKESEVSVSQAATPKPTELQPSKPTAKAEAPKPEAKEEQTTPTEKKYEFATIFGMKEEKAPKEPSEKLAREEEVTAPSSPESTAPPPSEEVESTFKKPQEVGEVPTSEKLKLGELSEAKAPVPSELEQRAEEKPREGAILKTVTVQRGDSLSLIAKRVYGDPNKWPLIYRANQDKIQDPNQIWVGTQLTIPPTNP